MMMAAWMGANAMSFSRAQAEALYLTDKMAYELNLNDQQYNDAYEINLDYFLNVDSPSDLYGSYYDYRVNDFRCILHDWQYSILLATDYFLRPLVWRAGGWFFPIYSYYNRDYFYYGRPSVWVSYRGRHSRYYHHAGFYTHRRPMWNGGLRGRDMHRPSAGPHRSGGNGYHVDFGGRRGGGAGMGSHGGGSHSGGNHSGAGYGGGSHSGGNHSGAGYGGGNHSGNSHSGAGYGSGSHSGGSRGGMTSGRSGNYGGRNSGSMSHGNSFDRSSSRMSGGSRGSGMTRSGASYGSRGGGSRSSGGSRSGGPSRGGRR